MTSQECWARLEALGFTKLKIRESYVMLQSPDNEVLGIPNLDYLTQEQRIEELANFMKRNMLC